MVYQVGISVTNTLKLNQLGEQLIEQPHQMHRDVVTFSLNGKPQDYYVSVTKSDRGVNVTAEHKYDMNSIVRGLLDSPDQMLQREKSEIDSVIHAARPHILPLND